MGKNHGPLRPFVQSFVLAPQSEKKYYVHSDIFQYLDDLPEPKGPPANQEEETVATADGAASAHQEAVPQVVQQQKADVVPTSMSNGVAHTEEMQRVNNVPSQNDFQRFQNNMQPMSQRVIRSTTAEEITSSTEPPSNFATSVNETWTNMNANTIPCVPMQSMNSTVCGEGECQLQPSEVVLDVTAAPRRSPSTDKLSTQSEDHVENIPSGPTTWAGVAKKPLRSAGQPTMQQVVPTVTTPAVVASNQTSPKPESNRPQSNRSSAGNVPPRMSNVGAPRMARQNYVLDMFPNEQQIFVGNLPADITPEELHKCFTVRIRPKDYAASYRQYPACAFVVFDSPETVLKVLEVGDVYIREKHKVNVEAKKPSEDVRSMRGGARGGGHRFDQDRGGFSGGMGSRGGGMGGRGGSGGGPGSRGMSRGSASGGGRSGRTIYPTGRSQQQAQQQQQNQ
ncbi:unnamed protein product [Soboliphyme baturini]|uniref:RRM domain-containing protein n=1 Tax=Soboliphyme baturini TaxID=241478 RepID=A0A183IJH4_9BILA|nr:unnamed protein product [Soboliphyme baturini]